MNKKLEEKRKQIDEARARKLAGLDVDDTDTGDADNSDLNYSEEDLPAGAVVTSHGDVLIGGQEVDPSETNAMGERAINNPEGNTSGVNRDTDTDGDADGDPNTWGHQGIDKGIEPQTTDPRVNQDGKNTLYDNDSMKTYDPSALPAGSPTPGVVAPTQGKGQIAGNTGGIGARMSARTKAELSRGAEAVSQKREEAHRVRENSNTIVTDISEDPDGEKGRKKIEKGKK